MNKFLEQIVNALVKMAKVFSPEDHVIIMLGLLLTLPTLWISKDLQQSYVIIMGEAFKWVVPTWAIVKILSFFMPLIKQIVDAWDRKTCVNCNKEEER